MRLATSSPLCSFKTLMATLRAEDLVGGPVDGPHAASTQLLLQGEPLVEGGTDHRIDLPMAASDCEMSAPFIRGITA